MTQDHVRTAVSTATDILDEYRAIDPITAERAESIEQRTEEVARKTLPENGETNLREWLNNLELNYDPEEFIEHDQPIPVTPQVIAVTVYIDMYPETMGTFHHNELHQKYMEPHTNMSQDEHFNMTERVSQLYD